MFSVCQPSGCGVFRIGKKPKVTFAVVGIQTAGKSTVSAALLGAPTSEVQPTLGFATHETKFRGRELTLFDLGGGERIREIWARYYAEVHGVIFVVDSSNQDAITESKRVLGEVIKHDFVVGKPILVLANKQDVEGAVSGETVRQLLDIDSLSVLPNACIFRIYECAARRSTKKNRDAGLVAGLRWLMAAVDGHFPQLSKRLGVDTEKQQETERIERNAKRARIRARKEAEEAAAAALAASTVATAHDVLDVMDGTRAPSCLPGGLDDPAFAVPPMPEPAPMSPARLSPLAPSRAVNTWIDSPHEAQHTTHDRDAHLAPPPVRGGPIRRNKVAPLPLVPTQDRSRSASPALDALATSSGVGARHFAVTDPRAPPAIDELADILVQAQAITHGGVPGPVAREHFEWQAARCSAAEGWAELQKQREDGDRFVIDSVAARVHAGWAQAAQHVWDSTEYGAQPAALPDPGEDECWAESSFSSSQGHGAYRMRLLRAALPFEALPAPAKEACRVSAEVLLARLCAAEPDLESVAVRRRDKNLRERAKSIAETVILGSAC